MKVIVVGGGTSGLMASVSAALAGAEVILLDKNPSLGRKLLLTGGTRCNVTNIRSRDEIIKHIPGNGRFLHSAFSQFDNQDIIEFFQLKIFKHKQPLVLLLVYIYIIIIDESSYFCQLDNIEFLSFLYKFIAVFYELRDRNGLFQKIFVLPTRKL